MINEPSRGAQGGPAGQRRAFGAPTPNANRRRTELPASRCESSRPRLAVSEPFVWAASSDRKRHCLPKFRARGSFGIEPGTGLGRRASRCNCYKFYSDALLHLGLAASGKLVPGRGGARLKGKTIRLLILLAAPLLLLLAPPAPPPLMPPVVFLFAEPLGAQGQPEASVTLHNQASLKGVWLAPSVAGFLGEC